jgi:Zn-dependent protease with chaperone function
MMTKGGNYMIISIIGMLGILLIIYLNKILANFYKKKGLRHFKRHQDPMTSVAYIRRLGRRYWLIFLLNMIGLQFSFMFVYYEWINKFDYLFFVSLLSTLVIYYAIGLIVNRVLMEAEMMINDASFNKEQIKIINRIILITLSNSFLFLLYILMSLLICRHVYIQEFNTMFVLYVVCFSLVLILSILLGRHGYTIYKRAFNAKDYVNEDLQAFVDSFHLNIRLYYFDSIDIKYAQAFALDYHEKGIFISSYLINTLTPEELKAVICHEIGHVFYRHTKKRSQYLSFGLVAFIPVNFLMLTLFKVGLLSTIFILLFIYLYFILIKNKIYQKQELESDIFMLKSNICKETTISMLTKMSQLTMTQMKGNKSDSYLSTHPIYQKRINNLKRN